MHAAATVPVITSHASGLLPSVLMKHLDIDLKPLKEHLLVAYRVDGLFSHWDWLLARLMLSVCRSIKLASHPMVCSA